LGARGGALARALDFLGLERNIVVMTSTRTLQGMGVALWNGFVPKVLAELGARPAVIGAVGTVSALVGVVFPFLGGLLSDQLGRAKAMVLATALGLAGYLVYVIAPSWWVFSLGTLLATAGASFGFMGALALTGDALRPQRRAISIAVQNVVGRLPPGLMPPLGGALILWLGMLRGVRVSLLVTIALSVVSIWLQRRHYRLPSRTAGRSTIDLRVAWRSMQPDLRRVLAADCLVRFGSGMSASFIVLYVMDVLLGTAVDFGLLTTIQVLASAVSYIPIAKLADRAGQSSRWPFVAATYVMFASFPLALALIPSARWLVPVFVVAGLRELGEPARKALIVDLADEQSRGSVIGAYYTLLGAVVFPSSLLGGLLWEWTPRAPLLIGAAITALGIAWLLWHRPGRFRGDFTLSRSTDLGH
jgi:MFS family permease